MVLFMYRTAGQRSLSFENVVSYSKKAGFKNVAYLNCNLKSPLLDHPRSAAARVYTRSTKLKVLKSRSLLWGHIALCHSGIDITVIIP